MPRIPETVFCAGKRQLPGKLPGYMEPDKMPLIRIHGVYHKITHKEIARLKGFPEGFPRSVPNKSRMYRSLVYAPNVKVTEQVVRNLCTEPHITSKVI